jgi:hypothetical protein
MRNVVAVAATMAVGMGLISCSEPPAVSSAATSRMFYEPPTRIERSPLPPPPGYASATTKTPTPLALSGHSPDDDQSEPNAAIAGEWRSSPRWAAVKGQGCIVVQQDAQAKLAVADTAKTKIGKCSKEDLDAGHGVTAFPQPGSSSNSDEPGLGSGSDESQPSNPYSSPSTTPHENRSDGTIEPWTGDI